MKKTTTIKILLLAAILLLSACAPGADVEGDIRASGIVEAVEVAASSEMGGLVAEVYVDEGDEVEVGDPLFRLDGELLEAQRDQALAAQASAEANLELARSALAAARPSRAGAELAVDAARLALLQTLRAVQDAEQPFRLAAFTEELPEAVDLPPWYFEREAEIQAAQAEVDAAAKDLETERGSLADLASDELIEIESRLAAAQAAYLVAEELQDTYESTSGEDEADIYLQELFDAAETELEAAQVAFDNLLSDEEMEDLLEARARVAVAEERHALALDRLIGLRTGVFSPEVQSARLMVQQAEIGVAQVDAEIARAEAAVNVAEQAVEEAGAAVAAVDARMEKLTVRAAVSGMVLARGIEPGEVLAPGSAAVTLGLLDDLTITVYLPEDRYGQVSVGDTARVSADSFPDRDFEAVVIRIADEAEFTPRNVQTQEERVTTVYAVELSVEGDGLKPGMPADVVFQMP